MTTVDPRALTRAALAAYREVELRTVVHKDGAIVPSPTGSVADTASAAVALAMPAACYAAIAAYCLDVRRPA